ncbi:hypothetical protein [Streptococcus cuniculi]|nr:hypothetical protein [Streptococcus cuniculi]MBF0778248.1 hypothetical protein [Streptococcus cuniculi]
MVVSVKMENVSLEYRKKVEEIVNQYPDYGLVPKIVACHYQEDAMYMKAW